MAAIAAGHWVDEGEPNADRLSYLLRQRASHQGEAQSKLCQHYDLIDQYQWLR